MTRTNNERRPYVEPWYAEREVYTLGADGEYYAGPTLNACSRCGVFVSETDTHTEWHEALEKGSEPVSGRMPSATERGN